MTCKKYIALFCILPIIIGGLSYILLRPEAYLTKNLYYYCHIWICIPTDVRDSVLILRILNNHFADFMWAISMSFSFMAYCNRHYYQKKTCICMCIVIGILMECILGTFDVVDIIVQWVAIYIATSQYEKVKNQGGRKNGGC